jgi:hypothetical protein
MAGMIQGFSLTVLVDDACDPRINALTRALLAAVGEAARDGDPRVFVESLATMPGERTFVVSLQHPLASAAVVEAVARALRETGARPANNAITAFPEFEQFRVGDQLTFER